MAVLERLLKPLEFRDGSYLPRVIPGPMDGVTEGSFLSVMSRRGYVFSWHTPFLRISTGVPARARLREKLAPFFNTGLPVTVQLMGPRPELLGETARRALALGACAVDLNCACPSPTVLSSGSGGKRLRDLNWMREAFHALREACGEHPFSVKVRIGFESSREFPAIAAVLRDAQPDFVIVHYRTVQEVYRAIDRAEGLSRLADAVKLLDGIPVYGSGDLFTVKDAVEMCETTGVAGLAPARGLMHDPLLIRKIYAAARDAEDSAVSSEQWSPRQFLYEIAHESGRISARANNGFVLRLAGAMCGRDSALFQKIVCARTLEATLKCLAED